MTQGGYIGTRNIQKGFTLVEIMIVVGIIALLASIAIPNLFHARMTSNDALAKSTLRTLSTAAENFSATNGGNYPDNESSLTGAAPPYLNKSYCNNTAIAGYTYDCSAMSIGGYSITATPVYIGSSGTTTETITTGGVLTP